MQAHQYFFASKIRLSNPGELGPLIDSFARELSTMGYSTRSIDKHVQSVAHLGEWAQIKNILVNDFGNDVITRFSSHSCACPSRRIGKPVSNREVGRIVRFFESLISQGILAAPADIVRETDDESIRAYSDWLVNSRGLSPASVSSLKHSVTTLLPLLGDNPIDYTTASVREVVRAVARDYGAARTKLLSNALRSYLKFLAASGMCKSVLVDAVPTVPHWQLSSLPRYIASAELEKVATAWQGSDCRSLRNRAIILLLARLGLRGRDVVSLRINDIDWLESTLQVTGKTRRPARLPLPQDVGDAVLAYLESARPALPCPEVFLRLRPPHGALLSSSTISGIVDRTLTLAGIENPPTRGANLLRHSAATAILRDGATLDEVSTILRHRSKNMTAHYAKVDLNQLLQLTQAWPENGLC